MPKGRKKNFSYKQAQQVIALCESGESVPDIADKMGMPRDAVYRMIHGTYYEGLSCEGYTKYQGTPKEKQLTDDQAKAIREAHHQEMISISELSRQYEVDNSTIRQILSGITYVDAGGTIGILSFNPYTPELVDTMRRDYRAGVQTWELVDKYDLEWHQVIHALKHYKEATEPPITKLRTDRNPDAMKIPPSERDVIRQYYTDNKVTMQEIADVYGVDISYISMIMKGKR